ncbi:MAG: SPOR domain-containing protein [Bacteroidetes bacterium]|nr:SPOR domain-containing protein [Bacteroidota bacterium]MCW5895837.1 SPOR domain-containing protein [Bacteroidota bacterium]
MKLSIVILTLVALTGVASFAQSPNIETYIALIENGQADLVRNELPSLLNQHPKNPGVLYLQALMTTDGAEAVRLYQNIVDNHPTSEWADDALHRVYKFYYAIGLFRTADLKLEQLKRDYPDSKYVAGLSPAAPVISEQKTATAQASATVSEPPTTPSIEISQPESTPRSEEVKPPVTQPPASPGRFTLQVGAFSTYENADKQKSFFTYHNYPAEVAQKSSGGRELFVVYVGSYSTDADARATGDAIRREFNMNYIIVIR